MTEELDQVQTTAAIVDQSILGVMTLEFQQVMLSNFNLTWLQQGLLDLYIIPTLDPDRLDNFNQSDLDFTWEPTSFDGSKMIIEMTFMKHSSISPLAE